MVVLPFTNTGGDPEQDYFADGVTESLTTDLSRISGSFVIARNTAFTFKGRAIDVKQVGRELNVRYVLEGSVQRSGNRLRVNVQLIDAETGNHIWAERFDKPVTDLFDMQDEIVARLANTLDAQLIAAEALRAERSLRPDTVDLIFQGVACVYRGTTQVHMLQARGFLDCALALEPTNLHAMLAVAVVDVTSAGSFITDDRAARFAAAEATLTKVLSRAPGNALAHMLLGVVQMFTNRAAQGVAECERALTLDRNLADAHGSIGMAKFFMGRGAETEAHIQEALRLSPQDIFAYRWLHVVGVAKIQIGADAEAVLWLRRSNEANRNFPIANFALASALAQIGALDQARGAAHAGLELDPTFTIRRMRGSASSDNPTYIAGRERLFEGMRLAGVPEG
jgi:TolB-like protein